MTLFSARSRYFDYIDMQCDKFVDRMKATYPHMIWMGPMSLLVTEQIPEWLSTMCKGPYVFRPEYQVAAFTGPGTESRTLHAVFFASATDAMAFKLAWH